jgi:hypothetical protein
MKTTPVIHCDQFLPHFLNFSHSLDLLLYNFEYSIFDIVAETPPPPVPEGLTHTILVVFLSVPITRFIRVA